MVDCCEALGGRVISGEDRPERLLWSSLTKYQTDKKQQTPTIGHPMVRRASCDIGTMVVDENSATERENEGDDGDNRNGSAEPDTSLLMSTILGNGNENVALIAAAKHLEQEMML